MKKRKAFSIIELIIAVSIFSIISSVFVLNILQSLIANRLAEEYAQAEFYAQEGIEAIRSIRNQSWSNLSVGTYGLRKNNGYWQLQTNPEFIGKYNRLIIIEQVQRNGNNIVESGGLIDSYTFKIKSIINWQFTPLRNNTIEKVVYLTYYKKPVIGNWSIISKQSGLNLPGSQSGLKVVVDNNYAYVITNASTNNFYIINISNLNSPSIVSTLSLPATLNNLVFDSGFVYISSSSDNQEMIIVNVNNPSSPSITSYFNASGSNDGLGISYYNNFIFLGRSGSSTENELLKINVSNKSSPILVQSLNTNSNINEIQNNQTHIFALSNNILSSNKSILSIKQDDLQIIQSLNLASTADLLTITGNSQNLYSGNATGILNIINSANSANLQVISTLNLNSNINDIDINVDNNILFAGTNHSIGEFKTINVTNKSNPSILGQLDLPNNINGLDYVENLDRVIAVTSNPNEELIILKPQ